MSGSCPINSLPLPPGLIIDIAILLAVIVVLWGINRKKVKKCGK